MQYLFTLPIGFRPATEEWHAEGLIGEPPRLVIHATPDGRCETRDSDDPGAARLLAGLTYKLPNRSEEGLT